MGVFINPGNSGFATIRNGRYIDKTEMIGLVNSVIDTPEKLVCVSRPRRFGKSFAAKMLCAYYDRSCDSAGLFDGLRIASDPSYRTHLQRYNVIYVDVAAIKPLTTHYAEIVSYLTREIVGELSSLYQGVEKQDNLVSALVKAVTESETKFVMIVDEWDAPIRECPSITEGYLDFLRMLFKGSGTTDRIFSAVYMTGILPVKKDRGQSAVSDFIEYTALRPGLFAASIGFTQDETKALCDETGMDFHEMKRWYDGYTFGSQRCVYNPYAVISALRTREFGSYWCSTSAADTLLTYIDLDLDGLQDCIVRLMAGEEVPVDTTNFKNDTESLASKDDALTLMIHLGYLTYEDDFNGQGFVRIPNEEVRIEFEKMLRQGAHPRLVRLVRDSDKLLQDTLALDSDAIAAAIARVHDTNYAPAFYNGEQALRHTVKMAYISAIDQYARVEELPSGHGLADIVFLPRKATGLPAMVVELKWNKEPGGAIAQIKSRDYATLPADLTGEVLLVGITYDEGTKHHDCEVERVEM